MQKRSPKEKYKNFYANPRNYNSVSNPIGSFGLAIYHKEWHQSDTDTDANITIKFLLQQRRDTFEYVDFILGTWTDDIHLSLIFSLMSLTEREKIRNYTHQELWCDFWVDKTMKAYTEGYDKSKKRYDSIRYRIPYMLDSIKSTVTEPPWGFPKGRKNDNTEKDSDCAMREFLEEIPMPTTDLIKVDTTKRFFEAYQGTNGKFYSTCYFPAEAKECFFPPRVVLDSIRKSTVSSEVGEIAWVLPEDLHKYLTPGRVEMLTEIATLVIDEEIEL